VISIYNQSLFLFFCEHYDFRITFEVDFMIFVSPFMIFVSPLLFFFLLIQ